MSNTDQARRLYIDGEWREAANDATFDVPNPFDESLVGAAADATAELFLASDDSKWATGLTLALDCGNFPK